MMKIHTTQNLNSSKTTIPSTNAVSSKNFRLNATNSSSNFVTNEIAFKGKSEIVNKVAKSTKKEKAWMKKMMLSKAFRNVLDFMDHEVLVQALISFVICLALRPFTIMAMSLFNKKSKDDNIYAATQSIASGVAGFVGTLLIAFPFSKGLRHANLNKYAEKLLKKNVKDIEKLREMLKEMRPDINFDSIYDKANNVIRPQKDWRTVDGKKISESLNDVLTVARPTHYSECSAETFKNFGVDIDLDSQKGKSLYNMVTKDNKKVIESLKDKDMFIAVKEEDMGGSIKEAVDTNFFSLKFIDKDFLKKLSPELNVNSMEKDGKRLHPSKWLKIDGTPWLDEKMANNIHLPSFAETFETTPVYTGARRVGNNSKYESYLSNIENYRIGDVPNELGTAVTQEYMDVDKHGETKRKLITWIPDILTRPLVASGTIALIPWVLSNVFHMKKGVSKDSKAAVSVANKESNEVANDTNKVSDLQNPKFKAKGSGKNGLGNIIGDLYARFYANKMLYGQKWLQNLSKWVISKDKNGRMTEHMSTTGSLITSGVYVQQTLSNDKLDKQKRTTLAFNQALCFVVPTILAYFVNSKLGKRTKMFEYQFSGAMKGLVQSGKISEAEYETFAKRLPKRVKNVKTLATLLTFTLTYRYVTPVLITPIANWMGRLWQKHKDETQDVKPNVNHGMMDVAKDQKVKHAAA